MDTLSALLLSHPSTKMDPSHVPKFTRWDGSPPTLLNFRGTVAERHVENIKSMRSLGMKRFAQGCRELSEEESLLRQKVYNWFNGPGNIPIALFLRRF
jgi:hypothetical protein